MTKHPDFERYVKACDYPGLLNEDAVETYLQAYLDALHVKRRIIRLPARWRLEEHPSLKRYTEAVIAEFARRLPAALAARDDRTTQAALDARIAQAARDAQAALDTRVAKAALAARNDLDARVALSTRAALDALHARAARDAQAALDALDARIDLAARDAQAALDALDARAVQRFTSWCLQTYALDWRFELSFLATTWLGAKTTEVQRWSKPLFEAYISGCWLIHWTDDTLYWIAKPVVHVERPSSTIRRFHCATGPALESDIENLYFWHGVLVPEFVVTNPELITIEHIKNEKNLEVQRIMIERYGAGRYLRNTGAKLLDMDSLTLVGSAPRMLVEDQMGNRWLCVTDGSTARCYTMAVPRGVSTCSEAHKMISGLDSESRLIAEA